MKLSFHRMVQGEVNEAVEWYDKQREGLGDEFFVKLADTLDLIEARPESFGFWPGSNTVRRSKLKRFPYAVLFEIRTSKVRILCVRHEKRHPSYGRTRT